MFDTTMIGKRIKQARIDKNMTQMALADAMGVSYQAVSNWERGNSMPDISKLGDLCAALGLTVNELLGLEESAPNAVTKAMENEELTMEELAEVAPVLLPENLRVRMQDQCLHISIGDVEVKIQDDAEAEQSQKEETAEPEEESGEEHMPQKVKVFLKGMKGTIIKAEEEKQRKKEQKKAKKLDLSRIADMAPFLDQQYLDELVRSVDLSDLDGLEEVAPFLSKRTLDYLVEQVEMDDLEELAEIAPFLSRETVDKLVSRCVSAGEFSTLEELAPFVSKETLDRLAENVQPENIWEVVSIAPFFSQQALDTLVRRCEDTEEFDALEELAPFISKEVLDGFIGRYIEKGSDADLSDIYPFLGTEALRKLAKHIMEQKDLDALEDLMPFV